MELTKIVEALAVLLIIESSRASVHRTDSTAANACQAADDFAAITRAINRQVAELQNKIDEGHRTLLKLTVAAVAQSSRKEPAAALLLAESGSRLQAATMQLSNIKDRAATIANNIAKLGGLQEAVAELLNAKIPAKAPAAVAAGAAFGVDGFAIQLAGVGGKQSICNEHEKQAPRNKEAKVKVKNAYPITFYHATKADKTSGTNGNGPRACVRADTLTTACATSSSDQTNFLITGGPVTKAVQTQYTATQEAATKYTAQAKQTTEQFPPQNTVEALLNGLIELEADLNKLNFQTSSLLPTETINGEETKQALLQILKPGMAREKVSDHEKQIEELKKKLLKSDKTDAGTKLWQEIGKTTSPAVVAQSTKAEEISGIEDLGKLAATLGHYLVQETTKPSSKEQCNFNKEETGCDGKEQDKCNGKCEWKEINGKGECKSKTGEEGVKAENEGKTTTNTTGRNSFAIKKTPLLLAFLLS
ncbi:variant surface glycoprotein (VSG), putative [Trypanosoma equiperdum]|uniref:Variant surface glycoprotein (VSG), putative n=2 Tax=Trypanozoon TaxID=39700 RepID=Q380Y0_TRYB2|nr:variant surface glycoprotein [Trypanosoma brucei brucei TREU927]EAN80651.1 variant surface glycoprotein (VSG), putative [Trypanosoma brucei brucei TREU927]SCU68754.1 variant surface glycoprotein (VSG), putative [Trypanosoma equiperdum]